MAHGAVVERAMKDFLLISRRVVGKLLDVRVLREEGGGMSSHLLVEGKSRVDHTYLLTYLDTWSFFAETAGHSVAAT